MLLLQLDRNVVPLLRIVTMPFTEANTHQHARWMAELADKYRVVRGSVTGLSGNAWVCVTPRHCRAHFNAEGRHATIALCHLGFRQMNLGLGDVLMIVSPPGPVDKATTGSSIAAKGRRLLLCIYVRDRTPTLAPSTFHGLTAPRWVRSRKDVSYICRVDGADERDNRGALQVAHGGMPVQNQTPKQNQAPGRTTRKAM